MARGQVRGIAFDMYGTVVDVGAVAEACKAVAPDPVAFNTQWRAKQLEYTFLRSLMGKYQDFWRVSEQALEFTIHRFGLQVSAEQRRRLLEACLIQVPTLRRRRRCPCSRSSTPWLCSPTGAQRCCGPDWSGRA